MNKVILIGNDLPPLGEYLRAALGHIESARYSHVIIPYSDIPQLKMPDALFDKCIQTLDYQVFSDYLCGMKRSMLWVKYPHLTKAQIRKIIKGV